MPRSADPHIQALHEGARRSLEACSPHDQAQLHLVLWRRYKWGIIGVGLFLLYEAVMMAAGSTMGTHF